MAGDSVIALHASTLSVERVSCSQLLSRSVELVRHFGYEEVGIKRDSDAARGMSIEAKASGGGVKRMRLGGVTASLQSIGATGMVKPEARDAIACAMLRLGLLHGRDALVDGPSRAPLVIVRTPEYFKDEQKHIPLLINDYKYGGYNFRRATEMLNNSVPLHGTARCTCLGMQQEERFRLVRLERIENWAAFKRFKRYEAEVADFMDRNGIVSQETPATHEWLRRLGDKNELSRQANTVYLLHGTGCRNVDGIVRDGLKSSFSLGRDLLYGKGLYFTDKSCKAYQYCGLDGRILVCRVVLGNVELLPDASPGRVFPSHGFHSCFAKGGVTRRQGGQFPTQIHNEFVVFNEAACYPEFVLTVDFHTP